MIGHLIYTYNKVDDARISQEISRHHLSKCFGKVFIIHAFNGKEDWYEKYQEDVLVKTKNLGHYAGASLLINAGIAAAEKKKDIDYLLVTAADTWLLSTDYVAGIIKKMEAGQKAVATCAWDNRGIMDYDKNFSMNLFRLGMATDFFIIDLNWQRKNKLFPLDFNGISKRFGELEVFLTGNVLYLEKIFAYSYAQLFRRQYKDPHLYKKKMLEAVCQLIEREPICYRRRDGYWKRQMRWDKLGLYTFHDDEVQEKQRVLQENKSVQGKGIDKLRRANDFAYFNKV